MLENLQRKPQSNYVYLLRCRDGTLYGGWTTDLRARLEAHNQGTGAKYTRGRRPVALVYYETFTSKQAALRREYQIKHLKRKEKLKLIASFQQKERPEQDAGK